MEKNNKLLSVRDAILFLLDQWDLDAEECKEVIKLCNDEVNASDRRSKLVLVEKDDEE